MLHLDSFVAPDDAVADFEVEGFFAPRIHSAVLSLSGGSDASRLTRQCLCFLRQVGSECEAESQSGWSEFLNSLGVIVSRFLNSRAKVRISTNPTS